jgi:glycosyltransferase involved in cell wall biosynthesis
MKELLKRALFSILGKDSEAVVMVAGAGPHGAALRELVAGRTVIDVAVTAEMSTGEAWLRLRYAARGRRVAQVAVLTADKPLLAAALLAFPGKVLAFHPDLERHHISWREPIASLLFLRGLARDRIFLRPWRRNESRLPRSWRLVAGRLFRPGKPRVAVLSPYLPWPLAHGGAVRIHHLLEEAAREYDVLLFAFEDGQSSSDIARLTEYCSIVAIADKPFYREPRWSTLLPPETREYYTPELDAALHDTMRRYETTLLQVEYTQLARYAGDVLVEHDVTWDLYSQIHSAERRLGSWWNLFRWRRFESAALKRYRAVVAMSEKDARQLAGAPVHVIPNGVSLERFTPQPPPEGPPDVLFVGSFRHFPNTRAWRFFVEEVWPLVCHRELTVTAVAGPDPQLYWPHAVPDARITLHGFVADVKPLYDASTIVIIPTIVSAGTNLKALEAMAMARPIVSTPSGVAGLGLTDGESVLLADSAGEFAAAIERLLDDAELRRRLGENARALAIEHYGWPALGRLQTELWNSLCAN